MFKVLELSGLFVCLGGLVKIVSAWWEGGGGADEIAGLWFGRGGSVPSLTLWFHLLKIFVQDFSINFLIRRFVNGIVVLRIYH